MIDFDVLEARLPALVQRLPSRTLDAFMAVYADAADAPESGLELARTLVSALPSRRDEHHRGEVRIDHARIVHGDLVVDGPLVVAAHLIVTGSVHATTITTGYDHRVTVLGDVHCRMLFTDGALYVGGDLEASEVLWATGSGWFLRARKAVAKVYVNAGDHPDAFDERAFGRSFVVHLATRETVGEAFRSDLFDDHGKLAGWTLLAPIARGEDVFWTPPDAPTPASSEHLLSILRGHLDTWPGSQRDLLTDLEAQWAPRWMELVPEDREAAAKLVRRKIRSPKLKTAREALLESLQGF